MIDWQEVNIDDLNIFLRDRNYESISFCAADATGIYENGNMIAKISWRMFDDPERYFIAKEPINVEKETQPVKNISTNNNTYDPSKVTVNWGDIDLTEGWADDTFLTVSGERSKSYVTWTDKEGSHTEVVDSYQVVDEKLIIKIKGKKQ